MGQEQKDPLKEYKIYMSIDHLKKGVYSLKILDKEKVVKSIRISKK
jgi:hypothetical protein